MITITLTSNASEILARLQAFPERMQKAIIKTLDLQNELSTGHIQQAYLSRRSATTLGVVTNRLRLSVRPQPARLDGNAITSAIGSNVVYAGIHERGFNGTVNVREHTRKISHTASGARAPATQAVFQMNRDGKIRRTRAARPAVTTSIVTVRAHQMKMNMPARPYLSRGIRDRMANYRDAVSQAVVESWAGGNS